ncbi:MAG: hypothetical protein EXS13_14695 [Planctomycetes bacterium]|nr:hypothetical protein [Planctomycetota bacterium]
MRWCCGRSRCWRRRGRTRRRRSSCWRRFPTASSSPVASTLTRTATSGPTARGSASMTSSRESATSATAVRPPLPSPATSCRASSTTSKARSCRRPRIRDGALVAWWTQPGAKLAKDGSYVRGKQQFVVDGKPVEKWADADSLTAPLFAPDGSRIALIVQANGWRVALCGAKSAGGGKSAELLGDGKGLVRDPAWSPDSKSVVWVRVGATRSVRRDARHIARVDGGAVRGGGGGEAPRRRPRLVRRAGRRARRRGDRVQVPAQRGGRESARATRHRGR